MKEKDFKSISKLRSSMKGHHILLIYRGDLSEDIKENIISLSNDSITSHQDKDIKIQTFGAMVDCALALCQDQDVKPTSAHSSMIMLGLKDGKISLVSGSPIKSDAKADLLDSVEGELDLKDPNHKMMQWLNGINGGSSSHGGLIELAQKVNSKIEGHVENLGEGERFLTLNTSFNI